MYPMLLMHIICGFIGVTGFDAPPPPYPVTPRIFSLLCADERYDSVPLERIHATFAFIVIAVALALATIAFTVFNSYHTVKSWWKGPHMMYAASLLTCEYNCM